MGETRTRSRTTNFSGNSKMVNHRYGYKIKDYAFLQTETLLESNYSRSTISTEVTTDVVSKNFKKRQAAGEIINNPFYRKTVKTSDLDAPISRRDYYLDHYVYGDDVKIGYENDGSVSSSSILGNPSSSVYPATPTIDSAALIQLAVTKAHANVDLTEAQALVMAGEAKETIDFLKSSFKQAFKVFKAVKRLDIMAATQALISVPYRDFNSGTKMTRFIKKLPSKKVLAEKYMEARYAIRPIIYDVKAATNALYPDRSKPPRYTFRGFEKETQTVETTENLYKTNPFYIYGKGATTRTVQVSAGVLTQIDNNSAFNTWGLDQPIEALWELMPFSFIADWFFNIGSTIAALTPEVGVRELASWVTVRDEVVQRKYVTRIGTFPLPSRPTGINDGSLGNCAIEKRTVTTTRTVNPLKYFIPTFKLRLNALKLLDLGIIFKQLTRR